MNATEIKTVVKLDWTSAPVVRITANKDLPEFGIRAKQTVYLIRSDSLNECHEGEGTLYRIIVWGDRKATGWSCCCPGFEAYRRCHHVQKANAHSRNRAKRIAIQKAAQEQSKKGRWVKYNLSSFFEAMYCVALGQVVRPEPMQMQVLAANPEIASLVKVAPKPAIAAKTPQPSRYDAPLRGSGATGFGVQARLSASRKIASSVPMR